MSVEPDADEDAGANPLAELANDRPAPDALTSRVALSRLKNRLFGRDEAVKLGRYHLLEIVGAGGMGVVWGAWDPELDRRVAIKLVKATVPAARERMLLEGQTLAKLSHPNVVPIYDVGVFDDQIYLVMEWVRGDSLRAFASRRRGVRELVAVYRQVGDGLAAAHAAGLVHRDFKPDNAIRGDDGRIRVLDFGLARDDTDGGRGGTPRYMAPEQAAGGEVAAAADQYAFCVSLREALAGRDGADTTAAIPRWLDAIVSRGTRADPAERYPTMTALLHDLARDPAVRRRRWLAGVAAVAAVAIAFVVGRSQLASTVDRCSGGGGELAGVWNPDARAAISSRLAGLGRFPAQRAAGVAAALDRRATDWIGAHRQACTAHDRGDLAPELYAGRLRCLARSRAALAAAIELLAGATADNADGALVAVDALPDARACQDHDATRAIPPPADRSAAVTAASVAVERARVYAIAARPEAVAAAAAAAAEAEQTRHAPVVARALLVQGIAAMTTEAADAAAPLERAVAVAVESGDDEVAVEAFARLVWVKKNAGATVDGASVIEPLARRIGVPGRAARALFYNNLGTARLARGERDAARELFETARRELPADPADVDVELVCIDQNLALVADDDGEREQALGAVVAVLARRLGGEHSKTLEARVGHALATVDDRAARDRLAAACRDYLTHQPHLGAARAFCSYELAWLADGAGDAVAARAAMDVAARDPQRAERHVAAIAGAYLGGDEITALAERLATSPHIWDRHAAADAYAAVATARDRAGNTAAATAAWAAAERVLAGAEHPIYRRRLAYFRAALARHRAP